MIDQLLSTLSNHPYLIALLGLVTVYNFIKRGQKCDLPGPYGLPIIGYPPSVGGVPYRLFTKLAKIYGPIFQVKIGTNNLVVLNTLEVGIEAFGNIEFAGRPTNVTFKTVANTGKARFAFKPANEAWRFLRKVASRSLGLLASSRNSKLETVVREAQDYMESTINSRMGTAQNPKDVIASTVATVIGSVLFGFEFNSKNPVINSLSRNVEVISNFLKVDSIVDNLPLAEYFLAGRIRRFKEDVEEIMEIAIEHIERHQYNSSDDDVRYAADALVKVSEEATPAEIALVGGDKLAIRHIAADLFIAGFNTTTDSYRWFVNLIAVNQTAQKLCQSEIDNYLALTDRQEVSLADKGRMPYVDATMAEMLRITSLVPLSVPHSMMSDTIFRGYFIPAGTMVLLNIYAINHDEPTFPNPEMFRPERFLRDDGSFNTDKASKVIPFSLGKRRCVGESLARQELFMLFTNTVMKYDVIVAPRQNTDFSTPQGGFTRIPHNVDMIFTLRK